MYMWMIIRFSDFKVLQILQKHGWESFPPVAYVFCIQDDPISWSFSHDVMGKSSENHQQSILQVFELMELAVAFAVIEFLSHCHTCRNIYFACLMLCCFVLLRLFLMQFCVVVVVWLLWSLLLLSLVLLLLLFVALMICLQCLRLHVARWSNCQK